VHNSALVHAVAPLGNHFTPGQSVLSEREREIAVLVTWHWSPETMSSGAKPCSGASNITATKKRATAS